MMYQVFWIGVIIIASLPLLWALKKQYRANKKRFEEVNPHLKDQYFSFWKWFTVQSDGGIISDKIYRQHFGEQPFTNTDNFFDTVRQFVDTTKDFHKKISLPTRIAMIVVAALFLGGVIFN